MHVHFQERLRRAAITADESPWAFVVLPRSTSAILPRRGRTTVDGTLNGCCFRVTLEPDGQLSHWLRVDGELLVAAGVVIGEIVTVGISAVDQEPEPGIPPDLQEALVAAPKALAVWNATTTIARMDWIHWLDSSRHSRTRAQRIVRACDMLTGGKKRVCCFDSSGYYSKIFKLPEEVV